MDEDGEGEFTFWVYPVALPEDDVVVSIVAPAARDKKYYVKLNGDDIRAVNLKWNGSDTGSKPVTVAYNDEVEELDVTEKNLLLLITMKLE